MSLNSLDFLLFFAVVLVLQWCLPHRGRKWMLLAASCLFYGYWDWRFVPLLVLSALVNYYCGGRIALGKTPASRQLHLTASIIWNLGLLAFFKYANFFIGSTQDALAALGLNMSPCRLNAILPLGLSFYTFRVLSYAVDVYRGECAPARGLLDFALFVAFFPVIVAGPIERAGTLLPQLASGPVLCWHRFRAGSWLVLWGLFKKAVIADNLAMIVDRAFGGNCIAGGDALIAAYAFALQIYADFSGYSDISRGVAKMMGYDLMLNFRVPYFAASPREFWRRWHVSLSSWLRDYLYIPLGGNRRGAVRTYVNLSLTMLLGGLWHGAGWTFVAWGAYHGLLLVVQRAALDAGLVLSPKGVVAKGLCRLVGIVVTFHLVCLGWVLFRAQSLTQAGYMLGSILRGPTLTGTGLHWAWQMAVVCWPLALVQVLQERSRDTNVVLGLSLPARAAAYAVILVVLLCLGSFGSQEFIYAQF